MLELVPDEGGAVHEDDIRVDVEDLVVLGQEGGEVEPQGGARGEHGLNGLLKLADIFETLEYFLGNAGKYVCNFCA